jgi:hypothetical protein
MLTLKEVVLETKQKYGIEVTKDQISAWIKRGLLEKPMVEGLKGSDNGGKTGFYPEYLPKLISKIIEHRNNGVLLSRMAWDGNKLIYRKKIVRIKEEVVFSKSDEYTLLDVAINQRKDNNADSQICKILLETNEQLECLDFIDKPTVFINGCLQEREQKKSKASTVSWRKFPTAN